MNKKDIETGMKVHYIPYKGCTDNEMENGIVKSFANDTDYVFVVFHCGDEWGNYFNYTGQRTAISDLKEGWVNN